MESDLDILHNQATRKIYNLCLKETLGKKDISNRLYGKWMPNAILSKIRKLQKAGYLEFIETGKNVQKKRGRYISTMLPVLQSIQTKLSWTAEERAFLESEFIRKEFFRINSNLKLEEDWISILRTTFLDDMVIFRCLTASKVDRKFTESIRKSAKNLERHRNSMKNSESVRNTTQSGAITRNLSQSVQNSVNRTITRNIYDDIVHEMLRKYGEQHDIIWKSRKRHSKSLLSMVRTDYTCLSLLMPESLQNKIELTSKKRQTFDIIANLQSEYGIERV